ncbi:hypothetical protein [Microbacterium thalassium]|uniref:Uncharacterized protein n=1 Tax=Microbacterium thalassium TaxID=362649 RepID=A0A7X0FR35_9MICO|nr:hypothetical protein [Microbacterium thalassium]MBB6392150.1 hypothetical protein [Microbacterium thalassium]GLK24892.1 hypothetical protein GCM10017607_22100 [Microbacterium thalassium]
MEYTERATDRSVSRRTVTKAAAWAVPVIAVAAAVPEATASETPTGGAGATGNVSVQGSCNGTGSTGTITVTLGPFPLTAQVAITLTHTGGGSFTATPGFPINSGTGTAADPYIVDAPGGPFAGVISIAFQLGHNQTGTVSASVAPIAPYTITGDLTGYVTKRRDGNSSNYNQCSAG